MIDPRVRSDSSLWFRALALAALSFPRCVVHPGPRVRTRVWCGWASRLAGAIRGPGIGIVDIAGCTFARGCWRGVCACFAWVHVCACRFPFSFPTGVLGAGCLIYAVSLCAYVFSCGPPRLCANVKSTRRCPSDIPSLLSQTET